MKSMLASFFRFDLVYEGSCIAFELIQSKARPFFIFVPASRQYAICDSQEASSKTEPRDNKSCPLRKLYSLTYLHEKYCLSRVNFETLWRG